MEIQVNRRCHLFETQMNQRFSFLYNYKGVPWVNAAAGILARSQLPYHSLVQDGEANVTRIRGKH